MKDKLKPCRKCHSKKAHVLINSYGYGLRARVEGTCNKCGFFISSSTMEGFTKAWNRRSK